MREKTTTKKPKESEVALKVEHVSKSFHLPTEQSNSIKQVFINRMRGIKGYKKQEVLKDISFEVKKGDFFGIVGRNGSGKSTLLKLISEIYTPDSGKITVNGSLVPFIELGVGFNPELTGRENVYLNGAMLGFSRSEIDDIYDEIVEFAELHDFMDQKLKNYSSGMQVRLAFSVAIKAQGDILVLDEVLAVGDEAFQRKCDDFFARIKKDKTKAVILVTHSMDSVRKYCNRAIMIRDGNIVVNGSPDDVANEYSVENTPHITESDDELQTSSVVRGLDVKLCSKNIISEKDTVEIKFTYKVSDSISTKIAVDFMDINRKIPLYASVIQVKRTKNGQVSKTIRLRMSEINDAHIQVSMSIRDIEGAVLAYLPESMLPTFLVRRSDYPDKKIKHTYAALFNRGRWSDE